MRLVFSDDALAMARANAIDVVYGLLQAVHRLDGHLIVQKFGTKAIWRGVAKQGSRVVAFQHLESTLVCIERYVFLSQRGTERWQIREPTLMQQQTVHRIAYRHTSCLGVVNNGLALLQIAFCIEVSVADACTRLYHRHFGILAHKLDEATATTRDNHIYQPHGLQHLSSSVMTGWQQLHDVRIYLEALQHLMQHLHNGQIGGVRITATLQQHGIATLEAE